MNRAKQKYNNHKQNAKYRGIAFEITFDEWYNWWLSNGVDKHQEHDHNKNSLCMCRYNDAGPYKLGNIYCDNRSANVSFYNICRDHSFKHKKIQTQDGIFDSRKDSAAYYSVSPGTIRQRILSNKYDYEK